MASQPQIIERPGPIAVPFTYQLGTTEVLRPITAFARWDGTAASGTFMPCLTFYSQDGKVFMRVFPVSTVAAGGVADVSYAPFPGGLITTPSGGSGTRSQPLPLSTPSGDGLAYPALTTNNGFTNVGVIVPTFQRSGTWRGALRVPSNYSSGAQIALAWVANATSGTLRCFVGTSVVAAGVSADTAYTSETAVNTVVPGTAKQLFVVTFTLTSTLVAGSLLNYIVTRDSNANGDTLAVDALLMSCTLIYTGS